MIHIKNLSFHYPNSKWVISNLNLEIARGTWNTIAGPVGSGKSTLAKLIKGIIQPQEGQVVFDSEISMGPEKIGYISGSDLGSVVGITVLDDICFGMENLCMTRNQMWARARNVLDWTGLLGLESRLTHTLSGGELQKLSLASTLASGANTLILDEAFSMLDAVARGAIRTLIVHLKRELALTIIEITNQARDISSRDPVIFLDCDKEIKIFKSGDQFLSSSDGIRWILPQGGVRSLLPSVSEKDRSRMKLLLNSLNITSD
ncbi:MAG: energy-coupling factor ABC transporter ATP-binding protein [Desulfomonilaceae bacterium]